MHDEPTVFVIDDDEQARKSVCMLVRSMGLAAEAFASAEEFLASQVEDRAGCVVTDLRMQGMSGIELQEKLALNKISLPVIILTAYAQTSLAVRAMKAGAITMLDKPYADNDLWEAIRKAMAEDAARRDACHRRRRLDALVAQLTPAERNVMEMIVAGKPNKAIAKELGVSVRTVEYRRHEVLVKMQAQSVAELVGLVIEARGKPS
jgi:RNA polymerase sigma factor (sigma-70 family)